MGLYKFIRPTYSPPFYANYNTVKSRGIALPVAHYVAPPPEIRPIIYYFADLVRGRFPFALSPLILRQAFGTPSQASSS